MQYNTVAILGLCAAVLTATPALAAPPPSFPSAASLVAPLDREFWAGVTYRDAIVGAVVVATGTAVLSYLTGSAVLAFTTAAAVTAGFIIYEPGFEVVPTPADLPTLPQLGLRGPPQREK